MKKIIFVLLSIYISILLIGKMPLTENSKGNNYIIILHVTEYNSKLKDMVEFIFNEMLKPEDQVTIISPEKSYVFSQKLLKTQTPESLIKFTIEELKKDIIIEMATFQQIQGDITEAVYNIGAGVGLNSFGRGSSSSTSMSPLKNEIIRYGQLWEELYKLRILDEKLLLKTTEFLKNPSKENHIYILFQKELRVIPNKEVMDALLKNAGVKFDAMELFLNEKSKDIFNVEKISNVFKEFSATLNFIYFKAKERKSWNTALKEYSGDAYNNLSKLSKITGGAVVTSSNAKKAFKKILEKNK